MQLLFLVSNFAVFCPVVGSPRSPQITPVLQNHTILIQSRRQHLHRFDLLLGPRLSSLLIAFLRWLQQTHTLFTPQLQIHIVLLIIPILPPRRSLMMIQLGWRSIKTRTFAQGWFVFGTPGFPDFFYFNSIRRRSSSHDNYIYYAHLINPIK